MVERGLEGKLHRRALNFLDRVFLVLFSRGRRKMGDANVEAAWHRASFHVSAYLALPTAAVVIVIIAAINALTDINLTVEHKRGWQIFGGLLCVLAGILLDRRFEKYLSALPPLNSKESQEEKSLVRWYRTFTIGTFALVCLGAYMMHEAGFGI